MKFQLIQLSSRMKLTPNITCLGTDIDTGLDTDSDFLVFYFSFSSKRKKHKVINRGDLPTKADRHHL